ncbi:MAG TPA: hypothetical protein VK154_13160 [Chitinophagales bacterium]|nr:hypothetical protein [Chitinophagales bacterium]
MGYDLHITRKEKWYDEVSPDDITIQEWVDYVKTDKELEFAGESKKPEEWLAIWLAEPTNKQIPFSYYNGCIQTKNPDDATIRKMLNIAQKLGAKVIGDEDEIWDESYLAAEAKKADKPWWKFW